MKKKVSIAAFSALLWVTFATTMQSCQKEQVQVNSAEQPPSGSSNGEFQDNNWVTVSPFDNSAAAASAPGETSVNALALYQRQNLLFNFGGEATNSLTYFAPRSLTQWNFAGKCCTYSIQRSSAVARTGSYATRYELRKTDSDVGGSKRAELSRTAKEDLTSTYERWYGASYYLPTDYANDVSPESLTQWHTEKGTPPLALWVKDGHWQVVKFGNQLSDVGAVQKGVWTDFVFHVKWTPTSSGLVEVWKNGVKVYSRTGQSLYSGLLYGTYMKAGIYKWQWKTGTYSSTTKRVFYMDDVRIGNERATYRDVAP